MADTSTPYTHPQEITDFLSGIQQEIDTSNAQKIANDTALTKGKIVRKYKICCLKKAEDTLSEYRDINNTISVGAAKTGEHIKENTLDFTSQNTALTQSLKDTVKALKDAMKLWAEMEQAACMLNQCLEQEKTCNTSLYNKMTGLTIEDPLFGGQVDIEGAIEKIKEKAKTVYGFSATAFNTSVDISGIQTFSHVSSLESFGNTLHDLLAGFQQDIETNMTSSKTQIDQAQTELSDSLKEMESFLFDKEWESAYCVSLSQTLNYVDALDDSANTNCAVASERRAQIGRICTEAYETFNSAEQPEEAFEQSQWENMK